MTGQGVAIAAVVIYGLLGTAPVAANPPAKETLSGPMLLERMRNALQTIDYKGTFVYSREGRLEAMHVIHRVGKHGDEERLTSLSGPPREVVRKQRKMQCILPRKHLVVVDQYNPASHFPMLVPAESGARDLSRYYHFRDVGEQRVAGRHCQVLALTPKDDYRYGYRLWLDSKTDLLLRSELIGKDGKVIERVMFTDIEMPEQIPAEAIEPTIDISGFKSTSRSGQAKDTAAESEVDIEINRLPPGYQLAANRSQRLSGIKSPVRHLVFTDGLASLSVFAAPYKAGKEVLHGPSRRGPVNAYGRVLDGYQITVVGDVPAPAVKMVAQSVEIIENKADVTQADNGDSE